MSSQSQRQLDALDWQILRELQTDARLSFNELSRRVGLSAPAIGERVRRMEEAGVISGYHAEVNPARIGLSIMALVQLRCDHDKCLLKTASAADYPEILEVLKVSAPHCAVLKVVAASVPHLEDIFNRLGRHGQLQSTMVWSAGLSRRIIDWEGGIPQVEEPPEWQ